MVSLLVQSLSWVWLFATPWTAARQASLSITSSHLLLKLVSIEMVMPSNRLIFCLPFASYLQLAYSEENRMRVYLVFPRWC